MSCLLKCWPNFQRAITPEKWGEFFIKIKSGNVLIIPYQLTKFQDPSSNSFWDILPTSLKWPNFQRAITPVSQFILPPGQLAPRGASQPRLACPPGGKLSRDILPPTLVNFTPGGQAVQAGLSCPPPIQRKFCCVMFTIICNTSIITCSS